MKPAFWVGVTKGRAELLLPHEVCAETATHSGRKWFFLAVLVVKENSECLRCSGLVPIVVVLFPPGSFLKRFLRAGAGEKQRCPQQGLCPLAWAQRGARDGARALPRVPPAAPRGLLLEVFKGRLRQGSRVSENRSHPNLTAFPALSSPAGSRCGRSFACPSGQASALRASCPSWGPDSLALFCLLSSAATSEALPTWLMLCTGLQGQEA